MVFLGELAAQFSALPAEKRARLVAQWKGLPVTERDALNLHLFNYAVAVQPKKEGSFFGMSTPSWIKDIGDRIRPIAKVVGSIAIGGVLGRIIGGTRETPTVAAGQASVAAQQAQPGQPDVGKVSTGAATVLGMKMTPKTMLLLGAIGIGLSLIFLKGR